MRWLRSDPDDIEGMEDVARSLEAAAADAPPSPRLLEIRTAMLEEVAALHQPALTLQAVVLAAVILLAVAVAIGAPAMGSILDGLVEDATPAPVLPEPDARMQESKDLAGQDPKPMAQRDVTVAPRVAAVETDAPASAVASATPSVIPSTTPSPEPSNPPIPIPTPPIPIPTPPIPIPTPPIIPGP
jgi:hypothetical protein